MRRTKEDAASTREQLLKVSLQVFRAKGYVATTLEEIARAAGTTRGALYWHFDSKADLFNTVIREQYSRASVSLGHVYTAGGTALEMLRRILVSWLSYAEEDSDFRTMLELIMFHTEIHPEMAEGMQEKMHYNDLTVKQFADMIQRGIASGEVRPDVNPEVAAIAAIGSIHGITNLWLLNQQAFSLKAHAGEMIDIFMRGIAQNGQ